MTKSGHAGIVRICHNYSVCFASPANRLHSLITVDGKKEHSDVVHLCSKNYWSGQTIPTGWSASDGLEVHEALVLQLTL